MTVTESGTKRINYHVRDGPLALTRHEARERHTLSRPLYTTHWTDGDSESALRNLWRECQSLRVPLLWLVNKTSWLPLWYGWILLYRLIFTSINAWWTGRVSGTLGFVLTRPICIFLSLWKVLAIFAFSRTAWEGSILLVSPFFQ